MSGRAVLPGRRNTRQADKELRAALPLVDGNQDIKAEVALLSGLRQL